MYTLNYRKFISVITIVAVILSVLILPSGNSTVHAAGTPWVKFDISKDVDLSKGAFTVIKFKSENITATSAAVSVTSNNSAVKVYNTIVEPGWIAGFTGRVVVKGITTDKSADLKIFVPGDASIHDDMISVNVDDDTGYFQVVSNIAATSKNHIYLKRGKTASLSAYAFPVEAVYSRSYPYSLFCDAYSVPSKKVKWKTSNKKIATVSKKGVVKVNKKAAYGKYATITATYKGDSVKYRVYVLKKSKKVTKLSYVGDRIKTMPLTGTWLLKYKATFEKGGANVKTTWSSSDNSILTVDSRGMITAKSVGIARITVKTGGKSLTYTVNVLSIPDFMNYYDDDDDDDYDED